MTVDSRPGDPGPKESNRRPDSEERRRGTTGEKKRQSSRRQMVILSPLKSCQSLNYWSLILLFDLKRERLREEDPNSN